MWSKVVLLLSLIHLASSQCTIYVKNDLTFPEPVFLKNNSLWIPNHGQLNWASFETNIIACPKSNISNTPQETAPLTCVSGSTFLLNGMYINISSVVCTKVMTGDYQTTSETCGTSGVVRNIGFEITGIGFIKYFAVCYDLATASVIYTKHTVIGDSTSYSIVEPYRPSFKASGVPTAVNVDTSYTIKSQQTRLADLLGTATQAAKFVNSSVYLARGHMTPDADGIFRSWQWDTYFYMNVAPQWQKVNAGNWLTVEKAIRTIADRLQQDVTVYTGTFDTLTLPHVNGSQIPITLHSAGILVPKWTWKVVKSASKDAAIALITNNDPYRTTIQSNELLCADHCREYGWYNTAFDAFAKGLTYCCNVNILKSIVKNIPTEATATNVLIF